ncbi:MAG: NAD-dependent epimerase/dehydratase family protein [Bacteroidetes bacterium]|nr:NAD-dependent epimerase/dehydratase family protein [Bacteroidota bacterium]
MDLSGIDVILHLAGKAHQMEPIEDKIYFDVNYELTRELALRAREQGVKQFIYISSTKVYGDDIKETLNESSPCHPDDAYGASKLKAEEFVLSLNAPGFTVAVLRPPVVYGPEVKGNIIRLLHLSDKNYPLPFGSSGNARSMVYVDNLVAIIDRIIEKSATGIFVAGDAKPLATDELIGMIRRQLGKPKRLVSVPGPLRSLIKMWKPALYTRLFGSFVVDNTSTNRRLDFTPPYSSEQGIASMVRWFRQTNG